MPLTALAPEVMIARLNAQAGLEVARLLGLPVTPELTIAEDQAAEFRRLAQSPPPQLPTPTDKRADLEKWTRAQAAERMMHRELVDVAAESAQLAEGRLAAHIAGEALAWTNSLVPLFDKQLAKMRKAIPLAPTVPGGHESREAQAAYFDVAACATELDNHVAHRLAFGLASAEAGAMTSSVWLYADLNVNLPSEPRAFAAAWRAVAWDVERVLAQPRVVLRTADATEAAATRPVTAAERWTRLLNEPLLTIRLAAHLEAYQRAERHASRLRAAAAANGQGAGPAAFASEYAYANAGAR